MTNTTDTASTTSYWIISYCWKSALSKMKHSDCIDIHPADWMIKSCKLYPEATIVLIFALPISNAQFNELRQVI
jgi:hypothetical protein